MDELGRLQALCVEQKTSEATAKKDPQAQYAANLEKDLEVVASYIPVLLVSDLLLVRDCSPRSDNPSPRRTYFDI